MGGANPRPEGQLHCDGLVGLKLIHETTAILTLNGRRRLVRFLLDHPEVETACVNDLSIDGREMKKVIRRGLFLLARAHETINIDDAVLSGTPRWKETGR